MTNNKVRADRQGQHERAYQKNRAALLKRGGVCGICGYPVDVSIKDWLDPMAATIDHIIPIAKGGHPSAMSNLQLAHRWCNRQKSDKLLNPARVAEEQRKLVNDDLPLHADWKNYKAK